MDNQRVAEELVTIARELTAASYIFEVEDADAIASDLRKKLGIIVNWQTGIGGGRALITFHVKLLDGNQTKIVLDRKGKMRQVGMPPVGYEFRGGKVRSIDDAVKRLKKYLRDTQKIAREMTASRLTSHGKKAKENILDEYRRYGEKYAEKVVLALMEKYKSKFGDDEFYHWPMMKSNPDRLKLTETKDSGKEYISIHNRASVMSIIMDGKIKISGKVYEVKDVKVNTFVHGL